MPKTKYPPHTEEIEKLAAFFDRTDTTELEGLQQLVGVPERELVNVSLRLPRGDVEVLKRVAAEEGLPPSTFMRWVLRRFVRGLSTERR
ncbi:MAG: hypothetical protein HY678_06525 [Chloroflexi bacterium]|nr:hypothetical protein [Chloroflexota bacterium]